MVLKLGLSVILLSAALPTAAQPRAGVSPAPPPAVSPDQKASIQRTAMAFGQCISAGIQSLSATVTPEAGATAVLGGCAAQRGELIQSVEAMIATMPEAQRAEAHAQLETQMGQAGAQIAGAIRQRRAAPPAAPAAPATPPH